MTQYPFIAARYYTSGGMVQPRAILWHMAEGYSTVSYLTHPRQNNSAHFVIERSGRIVQMVRYGDASHSAHVAIDSDDMDASDCGGLYSDRIARAVLGTGYRDINAYLYAVEVEGFRSSGPNALQADAIERLGFDLRAKFPTIRGNLGHRDVQDYKSCPGCKFPWARIGGHGLLPATPSLEADDMSAQVPAGFSTGWVVDVPEGTQFYDDGAMTDKLGKTQKAATLPYVGNVIGTAARMVVVVTATAYDDGDMRPTIVYMDERAISARRKLPPDDPTNCAAEVAADRARAYIAYR